MSEIKRDNPPSEELIQNPLRVNGMYSPSESTVYASTKYDKNFFAPGQDHLLKQTKKGLKGIATISEMVFVSALSEELAHFVQHTRGELPNSQDYPVKVSMYKKIHISGSQIIEPKLEKLTRAIVEKTFMDMGYLGYPPINGIKIMKNLFTLNLESDYLKDHDAQIHYSDKYPFEKNARKVSNAVLKWWFLNYLRVDHFTQLT